MGPFTSIETSLGNGQMVWKDKGGKGVTTGHLTEDEGQRVVCDIYTIFTIYRISPTEFLKGNHLWVLTLTDQDLYSYELI